MVSASVVWAARTAAVMRERRVDYSLRALDHTLSEAVYTYGQWPGCSAFLRPEPPPVDLKRAAYHAAMVRKWSAASDRPWLPVVPDPPRP